LNVFHLAELPANRIGTVRARNYLLRNGFRKQACRGISAGLDSAARAKVVRTLELLRTQQIVPAKFWKKLSGSDLWEVRVEYAGNIYRVLAAFAKNNRIILLHAFQKKSQKTPRQDMEIALQRQKRYFQGHGYL
jgi:phage-related protein